MEFDTPLRVRLVNECELVHAGLIQMLAEHADRIIVLPQGAGRDEIADVALVDPFTRRLDDSGTAPTTVTRPPGTARVAVFTWESRDGYVERAMLGGADGYLSKSLPALELAAALEKVCAGERIVALDLAQRVEPVTAAHEIGLTPRETHVVALIAAGAPNKEIARRLGLSMNTVKSHIRTAYRAMGVSSRTQAVLWAVEHGVTAPWVAVRDEVAS